MLEREIQEMKVRIVQNTGNTFRNVVQVSTFWKVLMWALMWVLGRGRRRTWSRRLVLEKCQDVDTERLLEGNNHLESAQTPCNPYTGSNSVNGESGPPWNERIGTSTVQVLGASPTSPSIFSRSFGTSDFLLARTLLSAGHFRSRRGVRLRVRGTSTEEE
jgi:hypothetical protein